MIGAAIAWRLAAEDVEVALFERGRLAQEASWAAAGMVAPLAEADGPGPFFDLCVRGRDAFETAVERLVRESGIDPEYDRAGILYVALNAAERDELVRRVSWQVKAGLPVEELSAEQALALEPALSRNVIYAVHMPTNRRTDNRKLCQAYARAAARARATLCEGLSVEEIIVENGQARGLRTHDGAVHEADLVVNAAGAWADKVRGLEGDNVSIRPVRGQIVCFLARPGLIGPALFSLGAYLVPRRDGRLLAGSTMEEAGYDKSVTLGGMESITAGARAMVPSLEAIPFHEAWAGLRPAAPDFLPVIGPSPTVPNVFWAAGHFRSGILLSALTGAVVADLVMGRKPAFDLSPFLPARFAPKS